VLSASPSPTISATAKSSADPAAAYSVSRKAMQRDIDMLKAESEVQKGQEEYYKNLKKEQLIMVDIVTPTELKFAGKPQVFEGDYSGQFVPGKKYKYFEDASAGGKRYYNVMDEFGVWVVFMYQVKF
jgi:hypothetical protein